MAAAAEEEEEEGRCSRLRPSRRPLWHSGELLKYSVGHLPGCV